MTINAYPLTWPTGWPRTAPEKREPARFHGTTQKSSTTSTGSSHVWNVKTELTIAAAVKRLYSELERLGAREIVVSTNVQVRLDGMPYSDQRRISDPGAAVYFKLKGKDRVLACDRWTTVAGNLAAVAAHIGAMRGMDRWGVGTLDQAFTGYTALPAPGAQATRHWQDVLRPGAPTAREWTPYIAESAYKVLLRERHPDRGGTHEQAAELNAAIEAARQHFGSAPA